MATNTFDIETFEPGMPEPGPDDSRWKYNVTHTRNGKVVATFTGTRSKVVAMMKSRLEPSERAKK